MLHSEKFHNDCTTETDVSDQWHFAGFVMKMDFGRRSYVAQPPRIEQILEQWCQNISNNIYRIVNRMPLPIWYTQYCVMFFVIYEFLEAYCYRLIHILQGLSSLSGKTSYRQISWGKSRSREIGCYNDRIVLTFDRYLGSACQILERLEKFKPKFVA